MLGRIISRTSLKVGLAVTALAIIAGCGGSAPDSSGPAKSKASVDKIEPGFTGSGLSTKRAAGTAQAGSERFAPKTINAGSDVFSAHGWWWDPAAPGTGFSFEAQGDTGFIAFFMYDQNTGRPTWFAASGPFDGRTFTADLYNRTGGQAAGNPNPVTTSAGVTPGPLQIVFDGNNATVQLPQRTINATRFNFNNINLPATGNQPESGWWWNATQSGRGFGIEVQNNTVFLAMFHYNNDGTPTWNTAVAPLTGNLTFSADFQSFSGGQSLDGAYRANTQGPSAGTISGSFTDACNGSLTLPGGINVPISKFTFGPNPCRKTAPPSTVTQGNLRGKISAEIVPQNYSNGRLDYGRISTQPMRAIRVEVLNAASGAVLASTATDGLGNYYVNVPTNTNVIVRAYSQMVKSGAWDFAVRDNTNNNALYVLDSPAFSTGSGTTTRDLVAGSGWGGSNYTGVRASGPFAILNTVYLSMQKVLSASPSQSFPSLNLFWSPNNIADGGTSEAELRQGLIGTSFFRETTDSGTGQVTGRSIYILGKENNDSDEFDATVVAHEWGHYFQSAFSRDDSVGGSHSSSSILDMRVAFSEGWGNALAGITLGVPTYADSFGASQQQGFTVNVSAPVSTNPGWYRENTVQYLVYDLHKTAGFSPVWLAMTGLTNGAAFTSIHSFAAAVNSRAPSALPGFRNKLLSQNINTIDAFGAGESNNAGFPGGSGQFTALPIYKTLTVGQTVQVCNNNATSPGQTGRNKLGSYVFFTFDVTTARQYTFRATGGTDPDFYIFKDGIQVAVGGSGNVASEVLTTNLSRTGRYVLAVQEYEFPSGSVSCFDFVVQ